MQVEKEKLERCHSSMGNSVFSCPSMYQKNFKQFFKSRKTWVKMIVIRGDKWQIKKLRVTVHACNI